MQTTTVLLVIIIAFVACYAGGVLRMGDEHADETMPHFMDTDTRSDDGAGRGIVNETYEL